MEHCVPILHKLTFVQLLRWYKIVIGPLQSRTKTAYFELQSYSKLPFFSLLVKLVQVINWLGHN